MNSTNKAAFDKKALKFFLISLLEKLYLPLGLLASRCNSTFLYLMFKG